MRIQSMVMLVGVLALSPLASGSPVDDNFNDNSTGPSWSVVIDAPSQLTILEQNQRLEVISPGSTSPNNDAIYLSNGTSPFVLSTASDFEIAIDYSFTSAIPAQGAQIGDALSLVLGIGKDLDGQDSAAIGFARGYAGIVLPTAVFGTRTNDVQQLTLGAHSASTGTLVISYNAAGDDLTASITGGPSFSLNDTVLSVWGASELFISFGARGSGLITQSGDAYLDNFVVRSGTIVPEPGVMGLALIIAGSLLSRRRLAR